MGHVPWLEYETTFPAFPLLFVEPDGRGFRDLSASLSLKSYEQVASQLTENPYSDALGVLAFEATGHRRG